MLRTRSFIGAALVALTLVGCQGQTPPPTEPCVKVGPCSCTYSNYHIDLSPVAANPGPKFKDLPDQFYNNKFSYNPCFAFTEASCTNVAVCQQNLQGQFFPCGSQESSTFKIAGTDNVMSLVYTFHDGDKERTSIVELICSTDDAVQLDVLGESPTLFYNFKLHSKACCPQPGSLTGGSSSMSVGSVLVIIFFAFLGFYLLAGVLFQKFARKASGKEVIPNISFWSGFFSLVKDGACIIVTRGKKSGYNNV